MIGMTFNGSMVRQIIWLVMVAVVFLGILIYRNIGKSNQEINRTWGRKIILLGFLDVICLITAYEFALWIRFDMRFSQIPEYYIKEFKELMICLVPTVIAVFYLGKMYHSIWHLAGISEVIRSIQVHIALIPILEALVWTTGNEIPGSVYAMGYVISFCMVNGVRFSYRILDYILGRRRPGGEVQENEDRIMVIGAGEAGRIIIKELTESKKLSGKVCCIIDDNPSKRNHYLEGIPVVGNRHDILAMVGKYSINHIVYAIPNATNQDRKEILSICKESNCRVQVLPGIYQLINEEVSVSKLRGVEIQDLLGREQITVNNQEILESIGGKVVLVTGGGGSIGSELCRQIAKAEPKQLIIFDIYENNAYEIQQELRRKYPELNLCVLIGSVRNTSRIGWVMETYHPEIVFHAAAHKHVPLMEDSPNEAIKNNVLGTYKTASAAAKAGVKRFVLISTDKAVNPTNIMGASKRLCEMVVQMMNRQSKTEFVAVRFGNVLGSNGSVIPLFRKQIAAGGPVTVTDRRMIRYFMTIPEAVALVLQASYYAKGGEIFVLDMGEPVKIDDMARNMIRLSGYIPDVDIMVQYTGLRPGEKLYEELLMDEEGLERTKNELIYIGHPIQMDDAKFTEQLKILEKLTKEETERMKEIVAEIVPTYHYQRKAI